MFKERISFSILILCVSLWSFAPSISFVFQMNVGSSYMMEICTPSGLTTIAINETGSIPTEEDSNGHPACSFCAIASTTCGATIPLPITAQHLFINNNTQNQTEFRTSVLSSSFKRGLNTPPRAPPVLS